MILFPKMALRTRIFLIMVLILFLSGVLILGSTSIQYESQRESYHLGRLDRKEAQIERHITHLVDKYELSQKADSLWRSYKEDLFAVHYPRKTLVYLPYASGYNCQQLRVGSPVNSKY